MQSIKTSALAQKYHDELHCNEVMLLPYYIASMNIEHEFLDESESTPHSREYVSLIRSSSKKRKQISFFTTKNAERVERQKARAHSCP